MTELHGWEMRSRATAGRVELTLVDVAHDAPAADEIIVAVQATPINPSDLGLLYGPADVATLAPIEGGVALDVPPARAAALAARMDQSLPIGNEGAGIVVRAGADAEKLLGRTVALMGGGLYAQYRRARAVDAMVLPLGVDAVQGASATINPLTALAMVETMRDEGHHAIVHTAAASNLGQMLARICAAEGVPLINIVRSPEQVALLRGAGAAYALDSSASDFADALAAALAETRATVLFDAIGGGSLAGQVLATMERVYATDEPFSRYGSTVRKQAYLYGRLDPAPTLLGGAMGMAWSVSGFLLTPTLQRLGRERVAGLRRRVFDEITTTFASHYTRTIGLREALEPEVLRTYARRATGEKFLIDPSRDPLPGATAVESAA